MQLYRYEYEINSISLVPPPQSLSGSASAGRIVAPVVVPPLNASRYGDC